MSNHQAYFLDDCLVLLHAESNRLLLFNATARLVWEWLKEGKTQREIAKQLSEAFGIPASVAAQDVHGLYRYWHELHLLPCGGESIGFPSPLKRRGGKEGFATGRCLQNAPRPPFSKGESDRIRRPGNRQDMAATAYFLANEAFKLRTSVPAIQNRIHSLFSHLEVSDNSAIRHEFELTRDDNEWVLYYNASEQGRSSLSEEVSSLLWYRILQISYPGREWLAIFHAAAVAYHDRAVLMPAPSGSGKTTLTAALIQQPELRYLGDDIVPLQREEYRITPLPTRLSIKSGSWELLSAYYPELRKASTYAGRGRELRYIDPVNRSDSCPRIHCLVFPQYLPEQEEAEFYAISAVEALQRLIEANVWLGHPLAANSVSRFLSWLREVPAYILRYHRFEQASTFIKIALN